MQEKKKQTNRRQTLDRLCSGSGLLLSVVCCIALIHVELSIQEHHRLISHSAKFCDKMETEILRKVQQMCQGWQLISKGSHWQGTEGIKLSLSEISVVFAKTCWLSSAYYQSLQLLAVFGAL